MEKKVLLGNLESLKSALDYYGRDDVSFVYLGDDFKEAQWNGITVMSFIQLIRNHHELKLIISYADYNARLDMAEQLSKLGIEFSIFPLVSTTLHIHGKVPELIYESAEGKNVVSRGKVTTKMYRIMFQTFASEFQGKNVDIWVSLYDEPDRALDIARAVDAKYIHAYCTMFPVKDRVIPIPDYFSCYKEEIFSYPAFSSSKCKTASEKKWSDKRAFWRGTIRSNILRKYLLELGRQHPEYLLIEDRRFGKDIPMPEQTRYKYLIDVGGQTWTDRLKVLLQLGRPILMVERPYAEWYFEELEPMKHYVPIKQDLSNLIERIKFLDEHPDIYEYIVTNMKDFSSRWLSPEKILNYLKETTLCYDVEKNDWINKNIESSSVYQIFTAHKTKIVLNGNTGFLMHTAKDGENNLLPIYAKISNDYSHLIIFVIDKNRRYYVQRINSKGIIILSDFPSFFAFESNSNDMISIVVGDQNISYISARSDGKILLVPQKYEWESFILKLV